MLRCPKCTSELAAYREPGLLREIKGWKCIFCDKFYHTDELIRAILTC